LEQTRTPDEAYLKFLGWRHEHKTSFHDAKTQAGGKQTIEKIWKKEVREGELPDWSKSKIEAYNAHLSGKVLILQPFATLRNLYEKESGFAISKYMIIELMVGLIIIFIFSRLAQQVHGGKPPKGRLWNLLEVFLVFIRDQVAKPSLGGHHEEALQHP